MSSLVASHRGKHIGLVDLKSVQVDQLVKDVGGQDPKTDPNDHNLKCYKRRDLAICCSHPRRDWV